MILGWSIFVVEMLQHYAGSTTINGSLQACQCSHLHAWVCMLACGSYWQILGHMHASLDQMSYWCIQVL